MRFNYLGMACGDRNKIKKLSGIGIRKSKSLLPPGTSLASVESLSVPLVQEIVLSADIRCSQCQKRVADIMSRMSDGHGCITYLAEGDMAFLG
ncbi:uncharacterized protein LOC107429430 isoform X4 [Ziziphus jujuba]|uniref:Uncharacterized protein LOC107429430 isoform X4 n=1 Tax=Ziziphus jujuba TaxID=326968 RepID=A0ABM3ZXU5_ZIZJJ|nr:uncharacterized protein LOC107429430 isoform X3 [Ziziphus jujuba var. spinosa]XP_060669310.1 uncharacterized protein LOC107429430 isoform X4 [Ziziphus jujuba]